MRCGKAQVRYHTQQLSWMWVGRGRTRESRGAAGEGEKPVPHPPCERAPVSQVRPVIPESELTRIACPTEYECVHMWVSSRPAKPE